MAWEYQGSQMLKIQKKAMQILTLRYTILILSQFKKIIYLKNR